jgi:hypothetical protein
MKRDHPTAEPWPQPQSPEDPAESLARAPEPRACRVCDGRGDVSMGARSWDSASWPRPWRAVCPRCKGSGEEPRLEGFDGGAALRGPLLAFGEENWG